MMRYKVFFTKKYSREMGFGSVLVEADNYEITANGDVVFFNYRGGDEAYTAEERWQVHRLDSYASGTWKKVKSQFSA